MTKSQCFVIKRGTDFHEAVKEHFELLPRWSEVFEQVSILLGEEITKMTFDPDNLKIVPRELTNEDIKKLFTKDGRLKKNLKRSNELRKAYLEIIKEVGLTHFEDLSRINFSHGVMRLQGQSLESFRTTENDVYYKADFDLAARSEGQVVPISEIEYSETYLNELKKREAVEKEV